MATTHRQMSQVLCEQQRGRDGRRESVPGETGSQPDSERPGLLIPCGCGAGCSEADESCRGNVVATAYHGHAVSRHLCDVHRANNRSLRVNTAGAGGAPDAKSTP